MAKVFGKLNDSGSFEHLEEGNFSMGGLLLFSRHVVEVNLFDRILFAIDNAAVQRHTPSSTLAKWSDLLVLGQASHLLWQLLRLLVTPLHFLSKRPALLHANGLYEIVSGAQLYKC